MNTPEQITFELDLLGKAILTCNCTKTLYRNLLYDSKQLYRITKRKIIYKHGPQTTKLMLSSLAHRNFITFEINNKVHEIGRILLYGCRQQGRNLKPRSNIGTVALLLLGSLMNLLVSEIQNEFEFRIS